MFDYSKRVGRWTFAFGGFNVYQSFGIWFIRYPAYYPQRHIYMITLNLWFLFAHVSYETGE